MSVETVREYLKPFGLDGKIRELDESSATVELAAEALGTEPRRIAKTMSFRDNADGCIIIVTAGDTKVDNHKFKDKFGIKPRMLSGEEVTEKTGHMIGGVCPFALPSSAKVYLDESLKRFATVFPACGSRNSAIELTISELENASPFIEWVDVCKLPE